MTQPWVKLLQHEINLKYGHEKGSMLAKKYGDVFPAGYREEYPVSVAVLDVQHIEQLSATNALDTRFYFAPEKEYQFHVRLLQWQNPIQVSDVLPIIENLDLHVHMIHTFKLTPQHHECIWIYDFVLDYSKTSFEISKISDTFQEIFNQIYQGKMEDDGFNKLILRASLLPREITVLRMYAKYLHQIYPNFMPEIIENAIVNNAAIAKELVRLFKATYDPSEKPEAKTLVNSIDKQILQQLTYTTNADDEKIIRHLIHLLKNTLRTNFFQTTTAGKPKDYIAIKLDSKHLSDIHHHSPLYETYVYSARFEGTLMRESNVSRGEIFLCERTETLRETMSGLMRICNEKNSLIVPSGAAGGLVIKSTSPMPEIALQEELMYCFTSFLSGLLDLTDNLINNSYIHPPNVVCHDDHDFYLVIDLSNDLEPFAAIANNLSRQYDFWLGDSFVANNKIDNTYRDAGISAQGTWEAIKRHLLESKIDVHKNEITSIGIGNLQDNIFGHGVLYTKNIKLIAAIDDGYIFLDPNPQIETAYNERQRLFNSPHSLWEDYNDKLISKGGGVFKRSLKSITLTSEVKKTLDISDETLTPNELIRKILSMPSDLLFIGTSGTYIKASTESQLSINDRTNEPCRINGNELRCKAIGEGSSHGLTQLARVEYAAHSGLINAAFVDNSALLDCSDHTVNLNILLDNEVRSGKLSVSSKTQIINSTAQEISEKALMNAYSQALIISLSAFYARRQIGLHIDYIKELKKHKVIDRNADLLPNHKTLLKRQAAEASLTRPELAVLLAHTKIYLKNEILKSALIEDSYFQKIVRTAFPSMIQKKYGEQILTHPLYRQILATQLSNQITNNMGTTFIYQLQKETSEGMENIIRAYVAASDIFQTNDARQLINKLDSKIPMPEQYEIIYHVQTLTNISTRWFLRGDHLKGSLTDIINHYTNQVKILEPLIPDLMGGVTKEYLKSLSEKFLTTGLPAETANRLATYRAIYTTLNIIDVATKYDFDLITTAKVYFASGERMSLLWFRDQMAEDISQGYWSAMSKSTLRHELDIAQCGVTVAIMKTNPDETDADKLINDWIASHLLEMEHWKKFLAIPHESANTDYTMFFILLQEFMRMIDKAR